MPDTPTTGGPRQGLPRQSAFRAPSSRLGWWSAGLMVTFIAMMLVNGAVFMRLSEDVAWRQTVLPFYGIAMMACGLAAGVLALIAVVRRRERSFLVWLPLLGGVFVIVFLLGEFLSPH